MATSSDYDLGEYQYPRGWFMIAGGEEATIRPVALRFFGQDMVLYRGETGTPHLVEAYCPHMGAHLAKNTTSYIVQDGKQVTGDSIRCPFHGWRYDGSGRCDDVPYSSFVPRAAVLRTFPVQERAGIIWMWHDPEGLEPDYPLPTFGGHHGAPGWVDWKIDWMGDLDCHPIELVDNMADFGHFVPIHGATDFTYFANEFRDHVTHQYYSAGHRTLTASAEDQLVLDTWYTGPSILQAEMAGQFDSFIMIAHTPIDDGRVRAWHALLVKVNDGSRPITAEDRAAALGYQEGSRMAFAQDIEIWQNKRPCLNPLVIPNDGPYGKIRTWYKQFYNSRDLAATFQKRVNGMTVTHDTRPGNKAA